MVAERLANDEAGIHQLADGIGCAAVTMPRGKRRRLGRTPDCRNLHCQRTGGVARSDPARGAAARGITFGTRA